MDETHLHDDLKLRAEDLLIIDRCNLDVWVALYLEGVGDPSDEHTFETPQQPARDRRGRSIMPTQSRLPVPTHHMNMLASLSPPDAEMLSMLDEMPRRSDRLLYLISRYEVLRGGGARSLRGPSMLLCHV